LLRSGADVLHALLLARHPQPTQAHGAVAKLIQRHLPNLLTYLRHRLTNAGLEGINAVIQWVKKTARGFHNAEHVQDRHLLLPLWRPRSLPTRKPVEPSSLCAPLVPGTL